MPVADKPDRHAVVARIANEAHANGERAADAVMARFAVSDRTATKVMSLARKAGHTIARDPDRRTPEQIAEWRRATLDGWLGGGRMFDPMPWKELANCKGVDPDLFFPEQGTNRIQIDQAKTVCRGCEVRIECFKYAMKHHEKGVWGGTSEIQRRRIRAGWLRFEDCA